MFTQALFILLVMVSCRSAIWENNIRPGYRLLDRFQYVPSNIKTAKKFMKNFLDRDPSEIRHKRSLINSSYYDVVFVLDSSRSVGEAQFKYGVLALQTLVTRAKDDTLYASIIFSSEAKVGFTYTNPLQTMKKVGKMQYTPGLTNTQAALELCRQKLFFDANSGLRPDSYKRILVVTDGQSNVEKQLTLYRAFQLKTIGIEIFVIAVGDYLTGMAEIIGLASSTDAHLFRVRNMKNLLEIVQLIPPWNNLRQQQKNWLANMYYDVEDTMKYSKLKHKTKKLWLT